MWSWCLTLSCSKQLTQRLQFFAFMWICCSSSDTEFILTIFESISNKNSSCSFKWLKKTCITSGSLYVKISPLYLGSCATRKHENPRDLCNSVVTAQKWLPVIASHRWQGCWRYTKSRLRQLVAIRGFSDKLHLKRM